MITMGRYISIRGWLECDAEDIGAIQSIIDYYSNVELDCLWTKQTGSFYNKGWKISKDIVNWTAYVFYGADIRAGYEEYIKMQIKDIMKVNHRIEGHFFLDDDEGENKLYWRVIDSNISEKKREVI